MDKINLTSDITITHLPELDEKLMKGFDGELVNKALEYGEIEVLVSNSGLDRHGERIILEGINISEIKKNPVLLWSHQYSDLPIGRITKIWKSQGNLYARLKFDHDIYEFADTVYKMILRGTINAVSIGGLVEEYGEDTSIIKKMQMIELSVVPVGAHPDALVTNKSYENQFEKFIFDGLKKKMANDDEILKNLEALKSLVGALEAIYNKTESPTPEAKAEVEANHRTLVTFKSTAKQVDKQAELLIAGINNLLKKQNG